MFLDPDPKLQKQGMSGFFSSQTPVLSPRESRAAKRKPLHERSSSRNNQRDPGRSPERTTVRLVKQSPSPSRKYVGVVSDDAKENRVGDEQGAVPRLLPQSKLKEAVVSHSGFLSADKDQRVSGQATSTNKKQEHDNPPSLTILPTSLQHSTSWHRRSISSGNFSESSTLRGTEFTFAPPSERIERLSQGTTLRGTPTPHEFEHRARIEADEIADSGSSQALATLQEAPQQISTIHAVSPSTSSSSADELHLVTVPSNDSSSRPYSSHSDSEVAPAPVIPRRSSRRTASTSSAQPLSDSFSARRPNAIPVVHEQKSQESIPQSEATISPPSSPNIITYSPEFLRARSGTHPLHYTTSYESIDSRLQYPSIIRPDTGRSLATSSSWASLQSSDDTLEPLQVPKKRLRHKPGSKSLGSQAGASYTSGAMSHEDVDTRPYPRQAFSSHLSTIASESDRTESQQLSHFSLGSGILTGDDASSIPLSGTWPRSRRDSPPPNSSSSNIAYHAYQGAASSSEEEAGDMTLGIFREESAKPEPLFRVGPPTLRGAPRKYEGQLPPLPPIPTSSDSDEGFDTLTDLQAPPLRQKRSGYSIRQRSNSTPSATHSRQQSLISYVESDRWSYGSTLFPTWAKHFYAGTAVLTSKSSLVSLKTPSAPAEARPAPHARNASSWTERSITSRLGTGYSHREPGSPASSHFLPSIFRPRTRGRANTDGKRFSIGRLRKSRPSASVDDRPESLAIFEDPLQPQAQNADEMLPSGQPRWGQLKENDGSEGKHPPLQGKYSTQKHWNQMNFPRPMSKDRLGDFTPFAPHLAPTKRSRTTSGWRPPSFVESLDELIHSQCNRQVLLFTLGFLCPLLWMVGAVLPLPKQPVSSSDVEKSVAGSEEDVQAAMMSHEAGDAERRWREERTYVKARWWRILNRIMSVVGLLLIAAVVALAVVATR